MPLNYRLRLNGVARLRDSEDRVVPFRTRKSLLLLAVLSQNPAGVSRAELAGHVWDEAAPEAARASLRTALVSLRAMTPGLVLADKDWISLVAGRLEVEGGDGEFLAGFDELWALDQRLSRRSEAVDTLLVAAREAEDTDSALALAEQACALDPLHVRASRLREELLRRADRPEEAFRKGESFRVRFVREFGSAPAPLPTAPIKPHPLVALAEWTLERDPDEACALLAGSQALAATIAVDQSLEIHERTLQLSHRPGRDRLLVESWTWYLRVLNGKVTEQVETLTKRREEALREEEPLIAYRLTEALAYACLSRGEFAKALGYARNGAHLARHRLDPIGIAGAETTLAIIEQHSGFVEQANRRSLRALRLMQEHGNPTTIAMHEIVWTGALLHEKKYDEALVHIEKCHRTSETLSAARMRPWVLQLEAQLHEDTGDLPAAKRLLEQFQREAASSGQAAIAVADDALFRVNCKLGELNTAAEALARGTLYRRRMGTVPSRFEHMQLAPSVKVIRERLTPRDIAAAFRRAAASN